ncbi:MAG TPA: hypothetical protein PKY77_01530 [Phycisphaerae bacterium]|nr:hypothetical protein [Phycisphaerae bacterium]HRY68034.1 hypothetical protein [Phycisphaerae bacterium]HSA28686.1 hypothetical protein [Phycisphaerae bacterium]
MINDQVLPKVTPNQVPALLEKIATQGLAPSRLWTRSPVGIMDH